MHPNKFNFSQEIIIEYTHINISKLITFNSLNIYIIQILIGPLCDLKSLNEDQWTKHKNLVFLHNFCSVWTIGRNDISMKRS